MVVTLILERWWCWILTVTGGGGGVGNDTIYLSGTISSGSVNNIIVAMFYIFVILSFINHVRVELVQL